jgi:hypothetical protein
MLLAFFHHLSILSHPDASSIPLTMPLTLFSHTFPFSYSPFPHSSISDILLPHRCQVGVNLTPFPLKQFMLILAAPHISQMCRGRPKRIPLCPSPVRLYPGCTPHISDVQGLGSPHTPPLSNKSYTSNLHTPYLRCVVVYPNCQHPASINSWTSSSHAPYLRCFGAQPASHISALHQFMDLQSAHSTPQMPRGSVYLVQLSPPSIRGPPICVQHISDASGLSPSRTPPPSNKSWTSDLHTAYPSRLAAQSISYNSALHQFGDLPSAKTISQMCSGSSCLAHLSHPSICGPPICTHHISDV